MGGDAASCQHKGGESSIRNQGQSALQALVALVLILRVSRQGMYVSVWMGRMMMMWGVGREREREGETIFGGWV